MDDTGMDFNLDGMNKTLLLMMADVLLPLQEWIEQKTYDPRKPPTNAEYVPWRDEKSGAEKHSRLSATHLGVIPFLEAVMREASGDANLLVRWKWLKENPLAASPQRDARAWREARGLLPSPKFGITESQNLPLDSAGRPIDRRAFYREVLPRLVEVAQRSKLETPQDCKAFVTELATDKHPAWSAKEGTPSSIFLVQFLRDLLYAMMGQRNSARQPWAIALLIELGEARRAGNTFRPVDVSAAVEEFEQFLVQFRRDSAKGEAA